MDKEKSTKFMLKVLGGVATALATGLLLVGDRAGLFKAMTTWAACLEACPA